MPISCEQCNDTGVQTTLGMPESDEWCVCAAAKALKAECHNEVVELPDLTDDALFDAPTIPAFTTTSEKPKQELAKFVLSDKKGPFALPSGRQVVYLSQIYEEGEDLILSKLNHVIKDPLQPAGLVERSQPDFNPIDYRYEAWTDCKKINGRDASEYFREKVKRILKNIVHISGGILVDDVTPDSIELTLKFDVDEEKKLDE